MSARGQEETLGRLPEFNASWRKADLGSQSNTWSTYTCGEAIVLGNAVCADDTGYVYGLDQALLPEQKFERPKAAAVSRKSTTFAIGGRSPTLAEAGQLLLRFDIALGRRELPKPHRLSLVHPQPAQAIPVHHPEIAQSIGVALVGGQSEKAQSLLEVIWQTAKAHRVHEPKFGLPLGTTLIGGKLEQIGRCALIFGDARAMQVDMPEPCLRKRVPPKRTSGELIQSHGLLLVFGYASTIHVHGGQVDLRVRDSLVSREPVEPGRLLLIERYANARVVQQSEIELRRTRSLISGQPVKPGRFSLILLHGAPSLEHAS
jgi:hypothetical protein